jgi:thioredoxin 2
MIRACPSCRAQNRVPARNLADEGKCGKCKAALPPVDAPIDADASTFNEILKNATVPVLVDFWATWCPPCRQVAPEVKQVAKHMAGKALVVKVDTEKWPQLAANFGVQGIPNFVVLKDGKRVFQQAGAVPAREMERWLERAGAT